MMLGGILSSIGSAILPQLFGGIVNSNQSGISAGTQNSNSTSTQNSQSQTTTGPGAITGETFENTFLPGLLEAFGIAGIDPYQGDLYAGRNDLQNSALGLGVDTAQGALGQGAGVRGLADELLSGQTLDPMNAPGFAPALAASIRPAIQAFEQSIVPQITSSAIASGAFGGSRNGVGLGLAADRLQENILDTAATSAFGVSQNERTRQLGAGNLINQAFGLDTAPIQLMEQLGSLQQQDAQGQLSADFQSDQLRRSQPFESIFNLGQGLNMVGDRVQNSTSTGTNQTQSTGTDARYFRQANDPGTLGQAAQLINLGQSVNYGGTEFIPNTLNGLNNVFSGLSPFGLRF